MDLDELKTALKRYGFDDTDPLETWINAAMHELERAAPWPFLESEQPLVTVAADATYVIGNQRLVYIKFDGDYESLTYMGLKEFNRRFPTRTTPGKPHSYTMVGTEARLYPVPDAVYTGHMVLRERETDLTDPPGDGPNWIPTDLHYLIVVRAAAFALKAENEEERAADALEEYNMMVTNAMSTYGIHTEEPVFVQDVMEYGS